MTITYVGLDEHKQTIAVALAETGDRNEVREHGKIADTPAVLKTLAARLGHGGRDLRFCYEAGPCGYGIQRQLTAAGHGCVVVAPSLIPRKPGNRIKTARRDAIIHYSQRPVGRKNQAFGEDGCWGPQPPTVDSAARCSLTRPICPKMQSRAQPRPHP